MAHKLGVTVEGELGCLGSLETMMGDKEDGHGAEGTMTMEQLLTDPEQAADFVRHTQLDALAIAIRSEEHTSELQSLMRASYAFFCLQNKHKAYKTHNHTIYIYHV